MDWLHILFFNASLSFKGLVLILRFFPNWLILLLFFNDLLLIINGLFILLSFLIFFLFFFFEEILDFLVFGEFDEFVLSILI